MTTEQSETTPVSANKLMPKFGIVAPQDAPFPTLGKRWRQAEELGFDCVYVTDHTQDWRHAAGYWLDGWTVLAAMATETSRVRIGTLVSNPILRPPALLAKEALAVDQLSGGRLELGIGTGIAGFDHDAMGLPYWSPRERAGRFAEYVELVDGLLRSGDHAYRFEGRYYHSEGMATTPGPAQTPRPPITVGGQSPTVLHVAAERADCWNTHGRFGATIDELVETTRRQNEWLDEKCESLGRDPRDLRRSLLLFDVLDAWASHDAFEAVVSRFCEAGMHEFVVFWPDDENTKLFERVATEVMPGLRA